MDVIKCLTLNLFYRLIESFRKEYNNYRDDHVIFRNLTQANGIAKLSHKTADIILCPTMNYPPKLRRTVELILQKINDSKQELPDSSGRIMTFSLRKSEQ